MWQKIIEFGKQLFSVKQTQQKHEEDIKELRKATLRLEQGLNDLSRVVERMAFEMQRDRENAARDREILTLRLENILLKSERGLPPASSAGSES